MLLDSTITSFILCFLENVSFIIVKPGNNGDKYSILAGLLEKKYCLKMNLLRKMAKRKRIMSGKKCAKPLQMGVFWQLTRKT